VEPLKNMMLSHDPEQPIEPSEPFKFTEGESTCEACKKTILAKSEAIGVMPDGFSIHFFHASCKRDVL